MPSATCRQATSINAFNGAFTVRGTHLPRIANQKATMAKKLVVASRRWSNCTVAIFSNRLRHQGWICR